MFDLEKEIRSWKMTLRRSEHLQDADLAELESHLRDEIAAGVEAGLETEAAFRAAVSKSAPAVVLGSEFRRARRPFGENPFRHPARFLPSLAWNALKVAGRTIRKHKGRSFLQIAGLMIGMTSFLLIMLYVRYESTFDTIHARGDRLYRVICSGEMGESPFSIAVTPAPLGPFLGERLPEIEAVTRFVDFRPVLFTRGEKSFQETGLFVDENFFRVFSFPLRSGDPHRALEGLDSIVISRTFAEKFFGRDDPLGQTLNCFLGDMKITGVAEDAPKNSHIQFDWLLPLGRRFPAAQREARLGQWNMDMYYTYLVLHEGADPGAFEAKMVPLLRDQYLGLAQSTKQDWWKVRAGFRNSLQPLRRIHLESDLTYELSPNGSLKTVRLFAAIAVFILLVSCVNAANLTTAQSSLRAKEIGVRKAVGARRGQLTGQFLGESLVAATAAMFGSLGLVYLILPRFQRFAGISAAFGDLFKGLFPFLLPAVILAGGLLSGFYPALVLSRFSILSALRRRFAGPLRPNNRMRNVLVMFQFGLIIALTALALGIFRQIRFVQNRDLGYDRASVAVLRAEDPGFRENLDAFKSALGGNPDILGVTTSSQLPTDISGAGGRPLPDDHGREIRIHYYFMGADVNFTDFAKMEIVRGRSFSTAFPSDPQSAILVNEAFVRQMGWANPVGKRFRLDEGGAESEIVGVVKDFHFRSLRSAIEPLVLTCRPNSSFVLIRLRPGRVPAALRSVQDAYGRFRIGYPFAVTFLDDEFNAAYASESKLGWMLVLFSGVAILLGIMGILGLTAATAERRTKEIGIRKILGASAPGVLLLMSKEYAAWILGANLLAWPAAFLVLRQWLQNFAYRAPAGIGVFVLSAVLALGIGLLTAGGHSLKTVLSNPVDSLRSE